MRVDLTTPFLYSRLTSRTNEIEQPLFTLPPVREYLPAQLLDDEPTLFEGADVHQEHQPIKRYSHETARRVPRDNQYANKCND
jgi:hypothetical protein